MKFDVSILPCDDLFFDEFVKEDIPEKYLLDEKGDFIMIATILNSQSEVDDIIHFLFNERQILTEVYRTPHAFILDLTNCKSFIVDFDHLENNYSAWQQTVSVSRNILPTTWK
jgi:hypothetical protein